MLTQPAAARILENEDCINQLTYKVRIPWMGRLKRSNLHFQNAPSLCCVELTQRCGGAHFENEDCMKQLTAKVRILWKGRPDRISAQPGWCPAIEK